MLPVESDREAMFSELIQCLETLRGKKFIFLPDPGNAGDSFIAHATYQLFERLALDFEIGNELLQYPGRVVVWGGGGNLVPLYVNLNNFLLANVDHCERIIILPHTIQGYETTLERLGPNCDIFCRDRMTYDYVRQQAGNACVKLSHDLAFSADLNITMADAKVFPLPVLSDQGFARRNVKRQLNSLRYRILLMGLSNKLNCFRGDAEKTSHKVPFPNIDVSQVYATGVMSKTDSLETTYRMLTFIDAFKTVDTNRLHIAILSGMLGKTVNFYANSYGKNRAVFEHSMSGRFANVNWCG